MAIEEEIVESVNDNNQICLDFIGLIYLEKHLIGYLILPSMSFRSYCEGMKSTWRRQIISCIGIVINIFNLMRLVVLIIKRDQETNMALGDTSYVIMKPIIAQAIYVMAALICIVIRVVLLKGDKNGTFEAPRLFHHLLTTQSKDLIISNQHRAKLCLLAKLMSKYFIPFYVNIGFLGFTFVFVICGYLALNDPSMHYTLFPIVAASVSPAGSKSRQFSLVSPFSI